jgi:hypothetical protein
VESGTGLQLDADGCPALPHGWLLCDTDWAAPLEENGEGGWTDWVSIGFHHDGTVTRGELDTETEGTGTWEYDGADTIAVRFDATVPSLGTDGLSLKVDEFERACGDPENYELWDALTSTQPALRFEPVAC